ncbi:hypothetical protein KRR38_33690 [Novosphingobium sp. G106]|uniref:hypothetical protein n=1 Tax=Novosphingobium sp. G106 TaxID=2849500 RepID=UPI001C2D5B09|nr:hypothetical protein [Novosphingobium sp. G106]MBV1692188.1 hypothetical protein [Novosphingobium sp. G106]MBV1692458.1 hypothetical protein [Novosphingobium sp. G106]
MSVIELAKMAVAGFGVGLAAYAAMETEPEQIARRAGYGILGLGLFIAVVLTS